MPAKKALINTLITFQSSSTLLSDVQRTSNEGATDARQTFNEHLLSDIQQTSVRVGQTSDERPTDFCRISDGCSCTVVERQSDVRQTSVGRPSDVRRKFNALSMPTKEALMNTLHSSLQRHCCQTSNGRLLITKARRTCDRHPTNVGAGPIFNVFKRLET